MIFPFTNDQLGVLNALCTYAVENLPLVGGDEAVVARIVGNHAIAGWTEALEVRVEKVNVEGVEVAYDAWEISIAGEHGDAMLAIYRQQDEAEQMARVLTAILRTALGEREVATQGFEAIDPEIPS